MEENKVQEDNKEEKQHEEKKNWLEWMVFIQRALKVHLLAKNEKYTIPTYDQLHANGISIH